MTYVSVLITLLYCYVFAFNFKTNNNNHILNGLLYNGKIFEKIFNNFLPPMVKRFAYIALLLIFASCLTFAGTVKSRKSYLTLAPYKYKIISLPGDTTSKRLKQQQEDEKKKIKEIAKAKRQVKPEKIDDKPESAPKVKPKRERRPEGLERPPEIPRRTGN